MPVPSTIADLSATASSNYPQGSESPSTLDDYIRAQGAIIRQVSDSRGDTTANLAFTGTGQRITGDFSNSTVANRVMFQTSTANSTTSISAIPSGSSLNANFSVYGNSTSLDTQRAQFSVIGNTEVRVISDVTGSGAYIPMTFYTGGSERMRIDTSGNVVVTNAGGGLGYGTGSGGTVTQATSRAASVTINKPTGQITMFSAAGSTAWASFQVNNSLVSANDVIHLSIRAGAANYYTLQIGIVGAGYFNINYVASGTNVDAPVINFAIIKGAVA